MSQPIFDGIGSKGHCPKGHQTKGTLPKGYQTNGHCPKGHHPMGHCPMGILLEVSASRQSELDMGRLGREADYPVTSIKLMARH